MPVPLPSVLVTNPKLGSERTARIAKLGRVGKVECFAAQLKTEPLAKPQRLEQREIDAEEARSADAVAAYVAEDKRRRAAKLDVLNH